MGTSYEGHKLLTRGKQPDPAYINMARQVMELQPGQELVVAQAKDRDGAQLYQKKVTAALTRYMGDARKRVKVCKTVDHKVIVVYEDPAKPLSFREDPVQAGDASSPSVIVRKKRAR